MVSVCVEERKRRMHVQCVQTNELYNQCPRAAVRLESACMECRVSTLALEEQDNDLIEMQ